MFVVTPPLPDNYDEIELEPAEVLNQFIPMTDSDFLGTEFEDLDEDSLVAEYFVDLDSPTSNTK